RQSVAGTTKKADALTVCIGLPLGRPASVRACLRGSATSSERGGARDGHERALFRFGHVGELCKLVGVLLQVSEETLELALQRVHLLAHVQDDLDAREIHT